MTTVDKIGISGVRSFEPQKEVTLRFLKPLTIILGHNGAGKTTIIECIKMACTGDLPPFTDKGGAFVHDPKITSSTETKAKIRLQFTDVAGKKIVVNRQFQVTNKANKRQEFKTVEQSLQYTNENGEKQTVSHRCNDVNKTVPELMGVSKAILENVIFVHQEESLWPLADGKKLKEKFDDIFASTRYTKALEAIRKQRKEHMIVIRERKAELLLWKDRMVRAQKIKHEMSKLEDDRRIVQEEVKNLEERMAETNEKLQDVRKKIAKVQEAEELERRLDAQRSAKLEAKDALYSEMEDELDDDDSELDKWIKQATEKLRVLNESRGSRLSDIERMKEESKTLSEELKQLTAKKGRLDAEALIFEELKDEMRDLKRKLVKAEYHRHDGRELTEDDDYRAWHSALEQRNSSLERTMKELVQSNRKKQASMANDSNRIQMEIAQLEKTMTTARDSAMETRQKIVSRREELRTSTGTEDPEEQVVFEKERLSRALETLEGRKKQVDDLRTEKKYEEKQNELQELRKKIASLYEQRKSCAHSEDSKFRVQVLKEQLREKGEARKVKERKLKEFISSVSGEDSSLVSDDLHVYVSNVADNLLETLNSAESKLSNLRNELSGKEVEQQLLHEGVRKIADSMASYETRLREASKSNSQVVNETTFKKILDDTTSRLEGLMEDARVMRYGGEFLNSLIERGRHANCCPTCDRGFQSKDELDALLAKLTRRKEKSLGSKLKEKEKNAEQEKEKLEQLKPLIPFWDEKEKARFELEKEKDRYRLVQESVDKLKEQIRRASVDLSLASARKTEIDEMKRLQQELRAMQKEHERLERDVSEEALRLGSDSNGMSLADIDEALTACHEETEKITSQADKLRLQRDSSLSELNSLEKVVRDHRDRLAEIEKEVERRKCLQTEVMSMSTQASSLEEQFKSSSNELAEKQERWKALQSQSTDLERECTLEEEKAQEAFNRFHEQLLAFQSMYKKIEAYENAGKEQEVIQIEKTYSNIEEKLEKNRAEIKKSETTDAKDADRARQFEKMVRNISDNIRYRNIKKEIQEIERQLSDGKRKKETVTSGEDIHTLLEKGTEEWNSLNEKRHSAKGREEGLRHRYESIHADFAEADIKGSTTEHNRLVIELKTLELANGDLDKYYRALDHALMSYHTMKMSEINKTIKELWQTTYQGTDIDYIEIASDADSLVSEKANTKRNYNYRVVMRRGDALLDMRGRCSAGQKVLACLIIRLALAESFALDCGILALDEPTTNLDHRNMEKLSASLADIINNRRRQSNFQLILITHDEEFIELLGSREICDSYYLVYKDDEGYSRVKQQDLVTFT